MTETKKKTTRKKKAGASAPAPSIPQMTFTEEEVQMHANLLNVMNKMARFNDVTIQDCVTVAQAYVGNTKLNKKMEDNIFEIRRHIPAPKGE